MHIFGDSDSDIVNPSTVRGVYVDVDGTVYVEDLCGNMIHIPADRYRAKGYQPPIEELPPKNDLKSNTGRGDVEMLHHCSSDAEYVKSSSVTDSRTERDGSSFAKDNKGESDETDND